MSPLQRSADRKLSGLRGSTVQDAIFQSTHADGPGRETHGVEAFVGRDSVVLKNRNTTIGYILFSKAAREIDYIFVHPRFRRLGFGWLLVNLAETECGTTLSPAEPVSPLGQKFFDGLGRAGSRETASNLF